MVVRTQSALFLIFIIHFFFLQRMRSAMLVRTQLINEGTSAAAHLSLEHMLRGEPGEHERASALVKQALMY
jgi:hypothetical protein